MKPRKSIRSFLLARISLGVFFGRVIDLKTAKKKPSGASVTHRVQIATYCMLEPQASGRGRLDTLTKTKTVALHQETVQVSEADRKQAMRLYSIAREAMQSGIYLPNRNSLLCSRTHCSYWERCCDEYGGGVA
jgi:CRISPR/Cas system-associated exonuclease Cas4 (RecB family)